MLSASGASPVIQGGDDGRYGKTRHQEVGVGAIGIGWHTIRPAGEPGHPAQRGEDGTKTRLLRIWPPPPEHRGAEEDDVRLDLAQIFVPQAPVLEGSRGKILGDEVGPGDQALDELARLWMDHVHAHAIFIGVVVGKIATAVHTLPWAAEGWG